MSIRDVVLSYLDSENERLCSLAKEIWDHPELD